MRPKEQPSQITTEAAAGKYSREHQPYAQKKYSILFAGTLRNDNTLSIHAIGLFPAFLPLFSSVSGRKQIQKHGMGIPGGKMFRFCPRDYY